MSGSSGGGVRGRRPTDERQGNTSDGAKDGEEKATYTFLGQDDLGQLSSESKVSEGLDRVRRDVVSYPILRACSTHQGDYAASSKLGV